MSLTLAYQEKHQISNPHPDVVETLQYIDAGQALDLGCGKGRNSFYLRAKGFDVNRDHPQLLEDVFKVMRKGGLVFFSTNHQRFDPKLRSLTVSELEELSARTIPEDYRNKRVHRLWRIKV